MSREILFRGKRIDNGEWVYGFYFQDSYGGDIHHLIMENGNAIGINPSTIGQYTGLTDNNGTKIFEGDIVRCYWNGVHDFEIWFGNPVGESSLGWNIRSISGADTGTIISWIDILHPTCEVIGNIHESEVGE